MKSQHKMFKYCAQDAYQINDLIFSIEQFNSAKQQEDIMSIVPDDIMKRSTVKVDRSSVSMLSSLKYEDKYLKKFRQSLIHNIDEQLHEGQKPEIILKQLIILDPQLNTIIYALPIEVDPTIQNEFKQYIITKNGKEEKVVLSENKKYQFQLVFKIKHEIVYGLTLTHNIYKAFIKLTKSQYNLGSYGPGNHRSSIKIRTPQGFFSRGNYKVKQILCDKEGIIYGCLEFALLIQCS